MYKDVEHAAIIALIFIRQCVVQLFVALALGQLGVLFASNSILLCGQLELLCCSLRNARYTGLLLNGVDYDTIKSQGYNVEDDERHNYLYNKSEMKPSVHHYDKKIKITNERKTDFDIYSKAYDTHTTLALVQCVRMGQVVQEFKERLERFVSPLLALRVVQVTLYLCTLLYSASLKFDMVTVEYLAAVALDIYVYCYFGNQLAVQAGRVTVAAYQSEWPSMDLASRRLLLNLLLSHRRPLLIRAGGFLPIDLHTFVLIIKTSFSYYTLLVNVNEKK
ncbi:putative odorant receptor 71a [Leptidea sinapis]|uniref:putative odorant receptor 71a n=1 Tax=Leptidea sinapis TaxID=189913 RepID=UPI0021C41F8D|nr:putative odorant receptor 71a [Leptidea sinapis]